MGAAAEETISETVIGMPPARAGGVDHMNLAEFPLAALSRRRGEAVTSLEFGDEVFDAGEGRPVQRRLVISASGRFGLPTPADSDVLLVLIHRTNVSSDFNDRVVRFSRYELVSLLGWDHGGKSYGRLDEAFYRWAGCTLYYKSAWWDRSVRRWRSRTFHVLASVDLRGRGVAGDDGRSSVAWDEVLFETFRESNLKALDLDFYFRLKRPAARQAYRYLDKRFYNSERLEFDLRTFACEHLGLSRGHDTAQLKRALEPVLGELEDKGYLGKAAGRDRYVKRGRGQWTVVLVRAATVSKSAKGGGDLLAELTARGVWKEPAARLLAVHPAGVIRDYIALHDFLLAKRDRRIAKNPAGFLVTCISKRFPLPADFVSATAAAGRPCEPTVRPQRNRTASLPSDDAEADTFSEERRLLGTLSAAEVERLEAEASAAAPRFLAEMYHRQQGNRGPAFEQVRECLLLREIRRRQSGDGNRSSGASPLTVTTRGRSPRDA